MTDDFYDLIDHIELQQIKPKVQGTAQPVDVVAPLFSASLLLVLLAIGIFVMAGG